MRFEEVLPALREGKKIRIATWGKGEYLVADGEFVRDERGCAISIGYQSFLSDYWEIVHEPTNREFFEKLLKDNGFEGVIQFASDGIIECPVMDDWRDSAGEYHMHLEREWWNSPYQEKDGNSDGNS